MRKSIFVKIVATILAFLMLASVFFSVISALRANAVVSKSSIAELETKQKEIKQKKQDIQSKINSLEYDPSAAIAKKSVLDEQIQLAQDEIDNLTEQIAEYTILIEKAKIQVHDAEIAVYKAAYCKRYSRKEGNVFGIFLVKIAGADHHGKDHHQRYIMA